MNNNSKDFIIENNILKKYVGNSTVVQIPDEVMGIVPRAFDQTQIKELIIPGSVKKLGEDWHYSSLYYGEFPLEKLTILDGVEIIDSCAFRGYSNLKEINLPNTITEIGPRAFDQTQIKELIIPGSVKKLGEDRHYSSLYYGKFPLEKLTILDGVEIIDSCAFRGYSNLKEINLPNTITEIGPRAFDQTQIKELIIPGSVKKLGGGWYYSSLYYGEFPLEKLTILDGVETIDSYVFKNYGTLKEVNCYSPKLAIGKDAFEGTKIEKVSMHNGLNELNGFASSNIEKLEIMTEGSKIPKEYLRGFPNLKEIVIPNSINEIEDFAFYGTKIRKISLPGSVKKISELAFVSDSIEEIEWTSGIDSVDKTIFLKPKNLKTVYLPDNVKNVSIMPNLSYKHDICVVYKTLPFNLKYFSLKSGSVPYSEELVNNLLIENQEYKEIITALLKITHAVWGDFIDELDDEDVVYIDNIMDINYDNVTFNIDEFKKHGLSNGQIIDIISKNKGLRTAKITSAFQNFEYLLGERIIPVNDLKRVYFEDSGFSIDDLIEYYTIHKNLPELFNTLCVDSSKINQLELRDRLVSASTLNLLTDINDVAKLKSAKRILNRTNAQTIIESDNMRIDGILSHHNIYHSFLSQNCFAAIRYPVFEKLTGFNKQLFEKINNLDEKVMKNYTKTLSSYKSLRDELDSSNKFKNEFCGKILYGTILKMFNESDSISYNGKKLKEFLDEINVKIANKKTINEDLIDIQNLLANYFETVDVGQVIQNITENSDLYTGKYSDIAIKLMLKIDPYSFDMLRSNDKLSPSELELKYSLFAKKSGYLFDDETEDIYLVNRVNIKNVNNKMINYIEYINNQISINKIPKEEKNNYIKNVRRIVKNYIETSSENELFKLYRAIDLFLRSESEYLVQKEGSEELAKDIFDIDNPNYDNNDRLLYSMYNLNRLAHDTLNVSLQGDAINNYRIDLNLRKNMSNDFTNYLKASNVLSHFDLSIDEIYNLIDTKNYKLLFEDSITDSEKVSIIDNSRVSNTVTDIKDLEKIIFYLSKFKNMSKQYNQGNNDEIKSIRDKIEYMSNQYILFFETKNIIQEEIINKFSVDLESKLQQFNVYDLNTIEKKQSFYEKYGFVMEIQRDGPDKLLLAIYSHKFNEPFSLHMQNISPEIMDKINASGCLDNNTISHCKLKPSGLTDFNNSRIYSFKDNNFVVSGGFSNTDEGKCLLHNYLLYDAAIIKKKNSVILENMLENINNGLTTVTPEEMVRIIDKMSSDLNTDKFLLTNLQKATLDVSNLLVDSKLKQKLLEAVELDKGIGKSSSIV